MRNTALMATGGRLHISESGQGPVSQSDILDMGDSRPSPSGDRVGHDGIQDLLHVYRGDLLLRCLHKGDTDI